MTTPDPSTKIINWLTANPIININELCKTVGYDRSNFQKAFDGTRPIPKKHIAAFEKELKKYGYK